MRDPSPSPRSPVAAPTAVVGRWVLTRTIADRRADRTLRVDGTLTIARIADDELRWDERGVLRTGTVASEVSRTYLLIREDGGGWQMRFEDGREFHPWRTDGAVEHGCGRDTYVGTYDLAGLPARWSVRWDVTGPAKDYRMDTDLTPADKLPG